MFGPQHKHGWRFQKRPGLDMFLSQIGYPNFELVIYTTENAMTFYPIVDRLDPDNRSGGRESCSPFFSAENGRLV